MAAISPDSKKFKDILDTLLNLPTYIKHIIWDVSEVLVSGQQKKKMLEALENNLKYTPPSWYYTLIKELPKRFSMGILSNTSVPDLYEKYMHFSKYFSPIVYAIKENTPKPLPEAYKLYLKKLSKKEPNLLYHNIAMIDDKAHNLLIPAKLGIYTIHIKKPFRTVPEVHKPFIKMTITNWPD